MHLQVFVRRIQRSAGASILGATVWVVLLLLAGAANPRAAAAVTPPGAGTIPPLARFTSSASPNPVDGGEIVRIDVTIVNTDVTYVDVVLGMTATLPTGVTVITDSIEADLGQAHVTATGEIVWTGRVVAPGSILLSYAGRVDENTCGPKTNRLVLYEVENAGAGEPTPETLESPAEFTVNGTCPLYLPALSRWTPHLPALQNWNFEEGERAGWEQFDNGIPEILIYSTDEKQVPMPHGGKWFAWLAGVLDTQSEIRQKVPLPSGHRGIELRFLYLVESADACGADKDNGYVLINGEQVGPAFALCKQTASSSWKTAKVAVPTRFFGEEVELALQSRTNPTKNSNWLVDNVKFCSTDPAADPIDSCNQQE